MKIDSHSESVSLGSFKIKVRNRNAIDFHNLKVYVTWVVRLLKNRTFHSSIRSHKHAWHIFLLLTCFLVIKRLRKPNIFVWMIMSSVYSYMVRGNSLFYPFDLTTCFSTLLKGHILKLFWACNYENAPYTSTFSMLCLQIVMKAFSLGVIRWEICNQIMDFSGKIVTGSFELLYSYQKIQSWLGIVSVNRNITMRLS